MEKKEQLYEGKAKKVFATDDPNLVIVSYKDDATAFNGLKKGRIRGGQQPYDQLYVQAAGKGGSTHPLRGGAERQRNGG